MTQGTELPPPALQDDLDAAIERLRRVGTDLQGIEVKSASQRLPASTADSVSAFANAGGGLLILGVSEADDFTAIDIEAPKLAADLASLCSDQLEPPVRAWVDIAMLSGKPVVVASIPELDPAKKPCYVRTRGLNRGSFVRTQDGDRQLTSYEVHALGSARRQPKEDICIVPDVSLDDLDAERVKVLVKRMRSNRGRAFQDVTDVDILRRLGVVAGRDGQAGLTLAGLIALGIYPQQFLPQLFVSFTVSPTLSGEALADGTRFLDNQSLDGSVPDIIEAALRAMRRNMKRRAIVTGAGREDRWDYPETAIRELITNALMHRDYHPSAQGTQVRLTLYPDRFEVISPGGLYGPVSRDALLADQITSSRNAHLAKLLEDVEIPETGHSVCENRGSGLLQVAASLRQAGMAPPEIHDNIRQFRVVVRAQPRQYEVRESSVDYAVAQRQDRRVAIRDALADCEMSTAELSDLIGIGQAAILRWLRRMEHDAEVEPTEADRRSRRNRWRLIDTNIP